MKRRTFMARLAALAVGATTFLRPRKADATPVSHRHAPWLDKKTYWSMAVDIDKCIGCAQCVRACKVENDVPNAPFYFRTWIERYIVRANDEFEVSSPNGGQDKHPAVEKPETVARSFFVPKLCNHCETSPCNQVCPVGASFKTEDGVVLVDKEYCVGCRYCIQACPYASRYFNPITHTVDKCTHCYHRITKGLRPACVEVCPTGARIFGNRADENSPVSRFIRENRTATLKPHLGTTPKLAYKGLDGVVR